MTKKVDMRGHTSWTTAIGLVTLLVVLFGGYILIFFLGW